MFSFYHYSSLEMFQDLMTPQSKSKDLAKDAKKRTSVSSRKKKLRPHVEIEYEHEDTSEKQRASH